VNGHATNVDMHWKSITQQCLDVVTAAIWKIQSHTEPQYFPCDAGHCCHLCTKTYPLEWYSVNYPTVATYIAREISRWLSNWVAGCHFEFCWKWNFVRLWFATGGIYNVSNYKIIGENFSKREVVARGWRKPNNGKLHRLYTSLDIIRVIDSRRMR